MDSLVVDDANLSIEGLTLPVNRRRSRGEQRVFAWDASRTARCGHNGRRPKVWQQGREDEHG